MSQAQHAVRWVAVALLVFATLFIALVARGLFDPEPCGPLASRATPGSFALAERGEKLIKQSAPFGGQPRCYSVRLTAAHTVGERDSGYGLAVGDQRAALVVAVSPLGEAAVWQTVAGEDAPRYLLPWQPWPHVRQGIASNEIWLDVAEDDDLMRVTARINRELLWEGEVERLYSGTALWLGSFGGPVTVDFQTLDWFLAPST